jgi:hypothetical protein
MKPPLQSINKWNKEEHFAKAYTNPAKTYRDHFEVMKTKAIRFRKAIGFS